MYGDFMPPNGWDEVNEGLGTYPRKASAKASRSMFRV